VKLGDAIRTRFPGDKQSPSVVSALCLDPRFFQLRWLSADCTLDSKDKKRNAKDSWRDAMRTLMHTYFVEHHSALYESGKPRSHFPSAPAAEAPASAQSASAAAAGGSRSSRSADALLSQAALQLVDDDDMFVAENPDKDKLDLELDQLFSEKPLPMYNQQGQINDALQWWRDNKERYPLLVLAVRRFMSMPATEAPSERAFSLLANVVNKRRTRLSDDHVEQLMFLHANYFKINPRPLKK